MFIYDKKLQYPVKIDKPNPGLASVIISQYGGPDGELGASLRYLSQRYSMPFDELKGLLTDIGTEPAFWHPSVRKKMSPVKTGDIRILFKLRKLHSYPASQDRFRG